MRLALVISSLGPGGAERVLSLMANYWANHKHDIHLITISGKENDFYALNPLVKRVALNASSESSGFLSALGANRKRILLLRQALQTIQPDGILSFIDSTNVLTLLATKGLPIPVVISERIDPRFHTIGRAWEMLRRYTYPKCRMLVVQTESVQEWGRKVCPQERVCVIPNPVLPPEFSDTGDGLVLPTPCILGMGRLHPQKGFDLLIRAFAGVATEYPEWSLVILGEGEERNNLLTLANELKVKTRVVLPGRTPFPANSLRQGKVFVLSSHYEGFPNALLEAMSCGLPVISTNCPSGPADIIRSEYEGVLVPPANVEAMSAALRRLLGSEPERLRLGAAAQNSVERFRIEAIMPMWERLFHTSEGSGHGG